MTKYPSEIYEHLAIVANAQENGWTAEGEGPSFKRMQDMCIELGLTRMVPTDFQTIDWDKPDALKSAGVYYQISAEGRRALWDREDKPEAFRRLGRPRKGDSDKEQVVIAALTAHHQYKDGSVGNYTPAVLGKLEDPKMGLTKAAISRFLTKQFPDPRSRGYKGYVAACNKNNNRIGMFLALWNHELPSRLAELSPNDTDD